MIRGLKYGHGMTMKLMILGILVTVVFTGCATNRNEPVISHKVSEEIPVSERSFGTCISTHKCGYNPFVGWFEIAGAIGKGVVNLGAEAAPLVIGVGSIYIDAKTESRNRQSEFRPRDDFADRPRNCNVIATGEDSAMVTCF